MKKLMCCLLLGMCAAAAQAQSIPDNIMLFGYTLACNSQLKEKKEKWGRPFDGFTAKCFLPNTSPSTSSLTVSMRTYGTTLQPTVEVLEDTINEIAGENEKYIFSCPRRNTIIGGVINSSSPEETIILYTPLFTVNIFHRLLPTEPMFSSKKYLNQLCQWEP